MERTASNSAIFFLVDCCLIQDLVLEHCGRDPRPNHFLVCTKEYMMQPKTLSWQSVFGEAKMELLHREMIQQPEGRCFLFLLFCFCFLLLLALFRKIKPFFCSRTI